MTVTNVSQEREVLLIRGTGVVGTLCIILSTPLLIPTCSQQGVSMFTNLETLYSGETYSAKVKHSANVSIS